MGIVSLCEALKMNTKINDIRLNSLLLVFLFSFFVHLQSFFCFLDDQIEFDGAFVLSEMLKPNTTLEIIVLDSLKVMCLLKMTLHLQIMRHSQWDW